MQPGGPAPGTEPAQPTVPVLPGQDAAPAPEPMPALPAAPSAQVPVAQVPVQAAQGGSDKAAPLPAPPEKPAAPEKPAPDKATVKAAEKAKADAAKADAKGEKSQADAVRAEKAAADKAAADKTKAEKALVAKPAAETAAVPDGADATDLYYSGKRKLDAGDLKGAIADLRASQTLRPSARTLTLLGRALFDDNQLAAAIKVLQAAGNNDDAQLLLANVFQQQGKTAQARKVYEAFLKAHPDHPRATWVRNLLQTL